MSPKIVVLGSCMIDFVSYAPRLPKQGETLKGSRFVTNQGGKGANQCMAAAKLGGDTSLIARLGNDIWGPQYLEVLKKYNININHVYLTPGYSSGVAQIMVSESVGDNCIVIVPGANDALTIADIEKSQELLKNASILVCQLEVPVDVTRNALKQFKGISILNGAPANEAIQTDIFSLATIFCVNETEASIFTGLTVETIEQAEKASLTLLNMGCNTVILTLGDKGAVFSSRKNPKAIHIPTVQVEAIDTTGAGDAFIGSLAYLIAEKPKLSLAVQISIACELASMSVTNLGTHASFADKVLMEEICLKHDTQLK